MRLDPDDYVVLTAALALGWCGAVWLIPAIMDSVSRWRRRRKE